MYHDATAVHIATDLLDVISLLKDVLKTITKAKRANAASSKTEGGSQTGATPSPALDPAVLFGNRWKDIADAVTRLLTLCNTFTPPDLRYRTTSTVNLAILQKRSCFFQGALFVHGERASASLAERIAHDPGADGSRRSLDHKANQRFLQRAKKEEPEV